MKVAKAKKTSNAAEELFEAVECLENAAVDYGGESNPDNARYLREAALVYADAVAKLGAR